MKGGDDNQVDVLIVDGEVVFEKGQSLKLDGAALRKDVGEYEKRLQGFFTQVSAD